MCEANCGAQAAKDGKFVSKKTGIVRSGLCRPGAECVSAGGRADQVQGLAREVVSRRPDVLTAAAWNFVSALKRETTDIPIIMLATWEPQRLGFITSLARPAGNVTGVAWFDLLSKRMELLRVPRKIALACRAQIRFTCPGIGSAGESGGTAGLFRSRQASRGDQCQG